MNLDGFSCQCGCGAKAKAPPELIEILLQVELYFDASVIITSGHRCSDCNTRVGGSKNSRHMSATAADIVVEGVPPDEVHQFLTSEYPDKYGIGRYRSHTHVDIRGYKARWDYA